MLITYPVVDAVNPGLQVSEGGVDHRKELVGNLRVAAFGDVHVLVPSVGEVVIAFPVIGNNKRTRGITDLSTKPQSDFVVRSGTTASRIMRPAYLPFFRLSSLPPGLR